MDSTPVSLLERLREPNQPQAWARFVELYTPLLLFWARRLGLQSHDAADLVQEVFAALVQKLPAFTYDRNKTFRGWLRVLALNKWRDRQRLQATALAAGQEAVTERAGPDDVAAFWEEDHRRHLVARALEVMRAEFEPTTWKACWEFVVEGVSAAEVAGRLGISENAVYIAKCRVLRRLRQELEGMLE
jgi:RNA polymerase sigma-70 factor, ECF subfamily